MALAATLSMAPGRTPTALVPVPLEPGDPVVRRSFRGLVFAVTLDAPSTGDARTLLLVAGHAIAILDHGLTGLLLLLHRRTVALEAVEPVRMADVLEGERQARRGRREPIGWWTAVVTVRACLPLEHRGLLRRVVTVLTLEALFEVCAVVEHRPPAPFAGSCHHHDDRYRRKDHGHDVESRCSHGFRPSFQKRCVSATVNEWKSRSDRSNAYRALSLSHGFGVQPIRAYQVRTDSSSRTSS